MQEATPTARRLLEVQPQPHHQQPREMLGTSLAPSYHSSTSSKTKLSDPQCHHSTDSSGLVPSGNEENTTNGVDPSIERIYKRIRTDRTPTKMANLRMKAIAKGKAGMTAPGSLFDGAAGLTDRTLQEETRSESGPASVSDLRGWLSDFGKQQKAAQMPGSASKSAILPSTSKPIESSRDAAKNRFRANQASRNGNPTGLKPPIPTSASKHSRSVATPDAPQAASSLVGRMVDKKATGTRKAFTPIRVKPKINKEEVQATDNGYASVAKLSEWLANDPTSHKKLRHVRKGKNVIAKSRRFEKDMEDVIVEENQIERGAVSDKKKWLKDAFHGDEEDVTDEFRSQLSSRYAKSEIAAPKVPFHTPTRTPARNHLSGAQSEIIVDDAASTLSVSDKKDWLKNAFKKKTASTPLRATPSPAVAPRANSDVMHSRGESRDEVSARAKRKWLERSSRKAADIAAKTPAPTPAKPVQPHDPSVEIRKALEAAASQDEGDDASVYTDVKHPESSGCELLFDNKGSDLLSTSVSSDSDSGTEQRTGAPNDCPTEADSYKQQVQEDRSSVDFRAARALLIKRSKDNGNELRIASKVLSRKNKFERIEKDIQRKTAAHGLLKPSWGQNDPSQGASDAYAKSYIDDIAPKRSFEELP